MLCGPTGCSLTARRISQSRILMPVAGLAGLPSLRECNKYAREVCRLRMTRTGGQLTSDFLDGISWIKWSSGISNRFEAGR
jgi:hypothetical protein